MSVPEHKAVDEREKERANARAAHLAMEKGSVAAQSLKRLLQYSSEKIVELSREGDKLREKVLRLSAAAWQKK
jgi:hypothetical protein